LLPALGLARRGPSTAVTAEEVEEVGLVHGVLDGVHHALGSLEGVGEGLVGSFSLHHPVACLLLQ